MTDKEVVSTAEKIKVLAEMEPTDANIKMSNRLMKKMAVEYGRRNGWFLTERCFSSEDLANKGILPTIRAFNKTNRDSRFISPYGDHVYFYLDSNTRAIGVACHLYAMEVEEEKRQVKEWAERKGLSVAFPEDFPSWHYPGRTILLVYTRRGD